MHVASPRRCSILFLTALLFCAVNFGCGGGIGGGTPAAGQLSVNPASLSFGNVVVGQPATQSVAIGNAGGNSITVASASTSGPGFSISGLQLPLTLGPGQTASFSASFNPSNAGTASGSIFLTPSAGSTVTVALTGTGIAATQHSVDLQWNPSTSSVVGYYVYRGSQTGGPYTLLSSAQVPGTTFTDLNVQAGQSYYYVVTAVDANSVQSVYSNEANAVIPTP
jgi:hypothetical protein